MNAPKFKVGDLVRATRPLSDNWPSWVLKDINTVIGTVKETRNYKEEGSTDYPNICRVALLTPLSKYNPEIMIKRENRVELPPDSFTWWYDEAWLEYLAVGRSTYRVLPLSDLHPLDVKPDFIFSWRKDG